MQRSSWCARWWFASCDETDSCQGMEELSNWGVLDGPIKTLWAAHLESHEKLRPPDKAKKMRTRYTMVHQNAASKCFNDRYKWHCLVAKGGIAPEWNGEIPWLWTNYAGWDELNNNLSWFFRKHLLWVLLWVCLFLQPWTGEHDKSWATVGKCRVFGPSQVQYQEASTFQTSKLRVGLC